MINMKRMFIHLGSTRSQPPSGAPSSPNVTPKSPRKMVKSTELIDNLTENFFLQGFESYFSTLFRTRQDPKSILPDLDDQTTKDQPKLVTVKRLDSNYKQDPSTTSITSLADDPSVPPSPPIVDKHNHSTMPTSLTNIFKPSDQRAKRATVDNGKPLT